MDTISIKLIERKSLILKNQSLLALYDNEKDKNNTLQEKIKLFQENDLKQENINFACNRQIELVKDDLKIQKEITKKARRNGLKFLIVGIVTGGLLGTAL